MRKLAVITLILGIGTTSSALAEEACFDVQGMTCATCSITLRSAVKKLKGIQEVKASVEKKSAIVHFDPKETNAAAIKNAIDNVGYRATAQVCKQNEG